MKKMMTFLLSLIYTQINFNLPGLSAASIQFNFLDLATEGYTRLIRIHPESRI